VLDALVEVCYALCEITLVAMMVLIALNVFTRRVLRFDLQVTDELSGYMLVAVACLSLAPALRSGSFFKVEFLFARLPLRARRVLLVFFDLLSLLFTAVLEFELIRLIASSFAERALASTMLATPLWIPQLLMPVGFGAMGVLLAGMLVRDVRLLIRNETP
jgi:TRAP-type C4-dicarboxylate transport system permease small subunit